jgi:hypothetical protein
MFLTVFSLQITDPANRKSRRESGLRPIWIHSLFWWSSFFNRSKTDDVSKYLSETRRLRVFLQVSAGVAL